LPFSSLKDSINYSYHHPVARSLISSLVVGLSPEVMVLRRMPVLVEASLFAVFLVLPSRDFEVFRLAI
jgi:hypothetical protein